MVVDHLYYCLKLFEPSARQCLVIIRKIAYVQLNLRRTKMTSRKMNLRFGMCLTDDRLDANHLFPNGESRFHHCSVTASYTDVSPLGSVR